MSGPVTAVDAPPRGRGEPPRPACVEIGDSRESIVGTIRRPPGAAPPGTADRRAVVLRRPHGPGRGHRDRRPGHRAAPAHRAADRHLALRRRGAAPRQPRHRAADRARPAQPDDRRPRRVPLRGGDRQLPRHAARRAAVGGAAGRRPGTASPPSPTTPSCPAVELDAVRADRAGRRARPASTSPARQDTPLVGVDAVLRAGPRPGRCGRTSSTGWWCSTARSPSTASRSPPGRFAYLGRGRDELRARPPASRPGCCCSAASRSSEPILMWWNFVARDRAEIDAAYRSGRPRTAGSARSLAAGPDPRQAPVVAGQPMSTSRARSAEHGDHVATEPADGVQCLVVRRALRQA